MADIRISDLTEVGTNIDNISFVLDESQTGSSRITGVNLATQIRRIADLQNETDVNMAITTFTFGESQIADGAVTEIKIADRAVTRNKIGINEVITENLAVGSVSNTRLASNSVSDTKLRSSSVTSIKIANGAVTEAKIENSAVTEAKIENSAVTEAKIEDGAVLGSKIATNAITQTKISNGAVTEPKIASIAVTTGKIRDSAVTEPKIANDAIISRHFADNSIALNKLQTFYNKARTVTLNSIFGAEIILVTFLIRDKGVTRFRLIDSFAITLWGGTSNSVSFLKFNMVSSNNSSTNTTLRLVRTDSLFTHNGTIDLTTSPSASILTNNSIFHSGVRIGGFTQFTTFISLATVLPSTSNNNLSSINVSSEEKSRDTEESLIGIGIQPLRHQLTLCRFNNPFAPIVFSGGNTDFTTTLILSRQNETTSIGSISSFSSKLIVGSESYYDYNLIPDNNSNIEQLVTPFGTVVRIVGSASFTLSSGNTRTITIEANIANSNFPTSADFRGDFVTLVVRANIPAQPPVLARALIIVNPR